ncbi:hypothetical protein [Litorimonas haliclonae]|uniref:hypothetical protein n=1 Tax=Litorimonas haliclonae TaxID=2081977 RepID=UPI0039F102A3
MEIMTGLSAISAALKITKDLRELDVTLSNAEMKAKFAELYSSLADAKMALSEAKVGIQEKQFEINKLKIQLEDCENGERCPKCCSGHLKLTSDLQSRGAGGSTGGMRDREYTCDNQECNFVDARVHDPHGLLKRR